MPTMCCPTLRSARRTTDMAWMASRRVAVPVSPPLASRTEILGAGGRCLLYIYISKPLKRSYKSRAQRPSFCSAYITVLCLNPFFQTPTGGGGPADLFEHLFGMGGGGGRRRSGPRRGEDTVEAFGYA